METSSAPARDLDAKTALDQALQGSADPGAAADRLADDYRVRIPTFEGPLDLLLHLIRKDQLNIYDIPIAQICKSYLDYLDVMQQFDVNIAGEFMVMAATLTHMKSQILLPVDKTEEGQEDDPRLPLVAQLLEYERFKLAAQKLDEIPWLGRDIYPRAVSDSHELVPVESLLDAPVAPIDTFQMLLCLKIALDRTTKKPLDIKVDATSIKDKVVALTTLLEGEEVIDFVRLLPTVCRVNDVIVSFLAMLEMAKLKFIEIIQHETFGPIQIRGVRSLRELNAGLLDTY